MTSQQKSGMMKSSSPLLPALALVLVVTLVNDVACDAETDLTVNCSSTGYPAVPCSAPPNTVALDLSHNNMDRIPAGSFPTLQRLKRLLLLFNRISFVDPNAFQHNPVLEYLDISHNLLPQISALPFTSLHALAYLDISNNAYEDILLENSFDPQGNLRSLKLGSSRAVSIQKDHVKRLGELRLKEIHLVAGKINKYEPGSLTVLKNMDMLTLNAEYSQDLNQLFLILMDTCNSTNALTVKKFDLRKPDILIPVAFFQQTTISRMVIQDLMLNGTYCNNAPYFLNSRLNELSVENLYGEGECFIIVGPFDGCHLRKISVNGIDNRDFLRYLPQPTIFKLMECLTDISAVNIGSRYFPCEMSDFLINLKTLNVSVNELNEERLLIHCLRPFPSLQSLAIDHNIFQHLGALGNKTAHMKDLVNFTASYNSIHLEPQTVAINWTKSLRRLNLRCNQLSDEAFQFLPQTLAMLDVSYNNIHTIPNLQKMRNLQELLLSGNKIMTLHSMLLPSSVHLLYVDRNNMSTISEDTIRSLSVAELDFSGNPLHCDCDTMQLAQFCSNSSQTRILGWPSGYRCQSPDGLRNKTLEQVSLPWVSCHGGLLAVIILCCICLPVLPVLFYVLFKKLRCPTAISFRNAYSSVSQVSS